jgi:hypothetical protein
MDRRVGLPLGDPTFYDNEVIVTYLKMFLLWPAIIRFKPLREFTFWDCFLRGLVK